MAGKRVCVIVPTYNNAGTLKDVLNRISQFTSSIIVINDGSTDTTAEVLKQFENITIRSFKKNKGKGAALKSGFSLAKEQGYRYAITIDSDGQHFPEDIPLFVEKLATAPDTIIIGSRNMEQEDIPGKSSFGNKFSNFWINVTTGFSLKDTQSGYRLYPLSIFDQIHFYSTKYEFEVEVLTRAAWAGYKIENIPVKVYYAPDELRVSHYRPFMDFFRISLLNTILIILAFLFYRPRLFYRKIKKKGVQYFFRNYILEGTDSTHIIALSIGFGVFMGIVPVWGWQMAIAFAIASATGLNRALVLIASNISIPPMIPFILFGSYAMGGWLLGRDLSWIAPADITLELVKIELTQYIIGSMALALAAGIVSGFLTFIVVKIIRRIKTRKKRVQKI